MLQSCTETFSLFAASGRRTLRGILDKQTGPPNGRPCLLHFLLLQFPGGVGGEIGVDEAIDISIHHGGDIAVCPNGCASRRGPQISPARAE